MYRTRAKKEQTIAPFFMPVLTVHEKYKNSLPEYDTPGQEETERIAYEKGFEAGEKAGFAMGEQKALVLVNRLETLLDEISALRKKIVKETGPQVLELAVEIAKKIILTELEMNPDRIIEITKEALAKIERTGQITIKINSALNELFTKHRQELLNIHPDIFFDVDLSCPEHGVVVISSVEEVVTDIDTQLKNLVKELGEKLGGD